MHHEVPATAAGSRLDAFLHRATAATDQPWSQKRTRELCRIGAVALDGVRADGHERLRTGSITTYNPATVDLSLALGIAVAYADDEVVALQKPPGLAVHGGPLVTDSVASALAREMPGAGLLQRLDREASGLLLVGKNAPSLRRLSLAMEQGSIARDYLAIVAGELASDSQTIDLPLRILDEPRGDRPKAVVDPQGQRAVSHLRVIARRKGQSLVLVSLETGRTHQIRAHLAAIGHPLLGDPRYGNAAANAAALATHGVRRTLLHGARLRWPSLDGSTITVHAMLEPDCARLFPTLARSWLPLD